MEEVKQGSCRRQARCGGGEVRAGLQISVRGAPYVWDGSGRMGIELGGMGRAEMIKGGLGRNGMQRFGMGCQEVGGYGKEWHWW